MGQSVFKNRFDAGESLAERLVKYAHRPDVVVLGLPRGGVPVAHVVAEMLRVPLDLFIVRKLGVPGQEELAMGAIASGGVRVLNQDVVQALNIPGHVIEQVTQTEQRELERREREYRGDQPRPAIAGKTVILVDDGLATGSTMRAAVQALRAQHPARIVVAVPTAPPEVCDEFNNLVDEIVCVVTPDPFYGVGLWYSDFSQTTDDQVRELLSEQVKR